MKFTLTLFLLIAYMFGLIERSEAWYTNQRNGSFPQWLLALWLGLSTFLIGVL